MKKYTGFYLLIATIFSLLINSAGFAQTGFSNITISASANFGGAFSGPLTARLYTVTNDNAIINISTLVTELTNSTGSISISTNNPSGSQAGDILIQGGVITASSSSTAIRSLSLSAHGNISLATGTAITLTPANQSGNNAGRPGTSITMIAGGNVSISSNITTTGGLASAALLALGGGNGGNGGAISITATGTFTNTAIITTTGGNAAGINAHSGGTGGAVTINASGGMTVGGQINTTGGAASSSSTGGTGGNISFISSLGNISITADTKSIGGSAPIVTGGTGGSISVTANVGNISITGVGISANGGSGPAAGGNGGPITINSPAGFALVSAPVSSNSPVTVISSNGGDISITGGGGITLTSAINSTSISNLTNGSLTINDGATAVTSSGGTNDGQTSASVITVNNLVKTGAGNFNIAGTNAYVGSTTVNGGIIRVSAPVTGTTAGALGANSLSVTTTVNSAGIEFNNGTFTRGLTVTGNSTLDAYGAARTVSSTITGSGTLTIGANTVSLASGQDLTLSGAISGTIALVKSFSSTLILPVANSFTGTKTLNAGTLVINAAAALGTMAAAFTINGGALNSTVAGITTSNYLQTWAGDFSFTGTQSLNLGTGAVTLGADRQVTVNANTLTVGGVINTTTLSLTKLGNGTLAMGATAKTLKNLTISAGTLTSTSVTLTLKGDFNNNSAAVGGGFTHSSGIVLLSGTTQSITGSSVIAFNTLTIAGGSTTTGVAASTAVTFNINNGAKYIQQAGTTMPGTTKNFVAGSTYEVQAIGVNFSGSTYGNLILNYPSGNMSAAGLLTTVLNDLYVQNTGTGSFRLAANTSPTVTISGNLKLDAGTLNFSTGNGAPNVTVNGDVLLNGGTFRPMTAAGIPLLFVKGNWLNTGSTFNPGTTTVTFNSTAAPQNISGSVPLVFYNLTNSNTDFAGLSSDNDITVTNILSFASASNGVFSTGSNTVFVSNNAAGAVTRPGSGYIVGNLKRSIAPGGGQFDFPIGSFSGYTPVNLDFNSGNTAGDVNATTTDGVSANYPTTLSNIKQLARTWTLTNGGGGSFNADAIFTFLTDDLLNGATDAALKGYKFDAPSTYTFSANTSNTSNTFSFNDITSFSEFGAGECVGDLAVNGIITNVTCNSGSDGAITTTVTGNVTPVTYSWDTNPIQTTADISGLVAGTYIVTVTEETTCSASNTFVVTEPAAVPPPTSGGDQTVCSDGSPTQTLTATATSAFTVNWYTGPTGGSSVTPTQVGVGTSVYYAEAFDGTCSSLTRTQVTLTINPVPAAPISGGDQAVCSDGTLTQTLTATASGGTITWYPTATGGSSVTPTQVGVGTSIYYAEASDGTCSSLTRTAVTLTIHPLPSTPTVSVIQPTCSTATGTITVTTPTGAGFMYSIGGAYQSDPAFPGQNPGNYNNINVQDNFGCFSDIPASTSIDPQPFTPGPPAVNGIINVCPYLGTGDQLTYTASAPGATSYHWTLPPNVGLVSGQGTGTIVLTFNTGFSSQANKQLRVTASSICGTSSLTVFYLLTQFPNTPAPMSGPTNVCALIGTATTATYSIPSTLSATSYVWTSPAGTTFSDPNPPGVNDLSVNVTFNSDFAGGPVSVTAVNGCGTSITRSLVIPKTPSSLPGLISGPSNVCANILPGGTAAVYSITPVSGATSYTWTTPGGAVVTHPNGAGLNDVSITVQYPVGFNNGSISVSSTNGCGTSGLRTQAVNKLNPATPSVMDVIQTGFCEDLSGRVYTYTLSAMPANASTVQWTVPTAAGAVLVSGQGSTSITVSYPSTAVQGNVTAQSFNNCGASTVRTTTVKLPVCPPAFAKTTDQKYAGNSYPAALPGIIEVKVFPNPSISDFKLQVSTAGKELINIKVLDMQGREYKNLTVMPYQTISIGADLKPGSYMLEIIQGGNKKTQKLLKF